MLSSISRVGLLAVAVWVCAVGVDAEPGNKNEERELLETQKLVYSIKMDGRDIGGETIVRRTYNDNTVEYIIEASVEFNADARHDQHTTLLLEEESYFPRKFYTKKDMYTGGKEVSHEVSIEMFANVAVVDTRLAATRSERNFVLPTGTAFFEVGTLYPLYQLLFWYDRELGGRQSFYTFDTQRSKEGTVVLHMMEPETVATSNGSIEATVIEFARDEYKVKMYIDEDGRIVRAEQAITVYELVESSGK